MTLFGLSLVIAAAFCHAIWNFYVKRINGGPELVWLFSFVAMIIFLPVIVYIIVTQQPVFGSWQLVFMMGSVILHLAYFLWLQKGYRKGDLSVVYPVARSIGPIIATTIAVLLLGEHFTLQIMVGGLVIILGILFLTVSPGLFVKQASASLLFGVSIGLLIGCYTVWDAYAVSTLLISPFLLEYASSLGRSILLAPYAFKRRERVAGYWRDHRSGVIIVAVFHVLAYVLVLYALTFTPVVYVAPTRETSVLIAVLAGCVLLDEGDLARKLFWSGIILVGIIILASG